MSATRFNYSGEAVAVAVAGRDGPRACWGCRVQPWTRSRCTSLSAGRYDAHHCLPKSKLKRAFPFGAWLTDDGALTPIPRHDAHDVERPVDVTLADLLMDPRNGVMMGRWHHDQLEVWAFRPTLDDVPRAAVEFAREVGMLVELERAYP